jgi:hypothetical protein
VEIEHELADGAAGLDRQAAAGGVDRRLAGRGAADDLPGGPARPDVAVGVGPGRVTRLVWRPRASNVKVVAPLPGGLIAFSLEPVSQAYVVWLLRLVAAVVMSP